MIFLNKPVKDVSEISVGRNSFIGENFIRVENCDDNQMSPFIPYARVEVKTSDDSIYRKYEKTIRNHGGFKQCFNDVLGFRLHLDEYPSEFPEYFRVVDLRNGKKVDDGYRAIHLYYQRDNLAYPIEIQLWCGKDFQYNVWSHRHIYKYDTAEIGKAMYELYLEGAIQNEQEFLEQLNHLRGEKNGR